MMTKAQKTGWFILAIALILLAIRLALPYALKSYINHQLAQSEEYTGEVADVSLGLLQGRAVLSDITVESQQNNETKFIFGVKHLYMDISYLNLLRGRVGMDVILEEPVLQLYLLKAPERPAAAKKPTDVWQIVRSMLLPVPVDTVTVHQGRVEYTDQSQPDSPASSLAATEIESFATGLHEPATSDQPLPAELIVNANTTGQGVVQMRIKFNPMATLPTFHLSVELKHLDLSQVNSLLQSHTDLRVAQGKFSFYMEAESQNGHITGYIKPFFENLKVTLPKAKQGNLVKQTYKKVVNWLTDVLTNKDTKQEATKIDFSGSVNDPDVSLWSVISHLVENAYFKAIMPGLESSVRR